MFGVGVLTSKIAEEETLGERARHYIETRVALTRLSEKIFRAAFRANHANFCANHANYFDGFFSTEQTLINTTTYLELTWKTVT
jgi:hypothetical protein